MNDADLITEFARSHMESMRAGYDARQAEVERLRAERDELLAVARAIRASLPNLWGDHVNGGQIIVTLDENDVDALEDAIAKAEGRP
jgi:hypothetical protein